MQPSKVPRVGFVFRDLIDLEMPLWQDIFSIVFKYLDGHDLNLVLRSSKTLYQLVKHRAVMPMSISFFNDETCKRIMRGFYMSGLVVCENCEDVEVEYLLRQQYLEEIITRGFNIDLRVFSRRNESGNLLFPNLSSIQLGHGHSFEKCHFWEFLKNYPRRLEFQALDKLRGADFKKLVELGEFSIFYLDLPFIDCADSNLEALTRIKTNVLVLRGIDSPNPAGLISSLMNLRLNDNLKRINIVTQLGFRGDSQGESSSQAILNMFAENENFGSLRRLSIGFVSRAPPVIDLVCPKVKLLIKNKPLLDSISIIFFAIVKSDVIVGTLDSIILDRFREVCGSTWTARVEIADENSLKIIKAIQMEKNSVYMDADGNRRTRINL